MAKVCFTDEDPIADMKVMSNWLRLFFKTYDVSLAAVCQVTGVKRRQLTRFRDGNYSDPGYSKVTAIRSFIEANEPQAQLLKQARENSANA